MTERDRRKGTGGTEDNVRDELDDATKKGRKTDAVETEESTGGGDGGVKDNVKDEHDETQRH